MKLSSGRQAASVLIVLTLVSCGLGGPPRQAGSPTTAMQAADAFLTALVGGRTVEAWSHLTPATQEVAYDGDGEAFARDVRTADWSGMIWEFGPVTDLEISWGVHVRVDEAAVPEFLLAKEIAAGWAGFGLVLHVQTPNDQPYLIAAQGLDRRQ